ncbi:PAS domain-containing sensor histidine kinase [Halobacteria archaeon AArc-dxtr1]|nr:PAS domain-containing sensor histidine kinase [Halobacteria archaeon AArc-dxtr1]
MSRSADVRLPAAFDDLDTGITLHHGETAAILDGNDALSRLYGYSIEELRGMEIEDYTAPTTTYTQARAVSQIRDAAEGESQVFEWQIQRATGELRWVRVHLNPTTIDDTRCVLAEIHDITTYRSQERRLRLLNRVIRHNLRNEMTLLGGYADQIKSAVEDDRLEDIAETVVDIAYEIGSLSDSVGQLEAIASPDATDRSPTDLTAAVRSAAEEVATAHPDADVAISASEPVWVVADDGIEYAITHAVENAIVHNDRDAPSVSVTVTDEPASGRAIVRVVDDGPPIPAVETEVLNQDVTATEVYHGSGIGLWIMQWCVTSHGGDLTFEENDPRGNVVRFSLPRTEPPTDD